LSARTHTGLGSFYGISQRRVKRQVDSWMDCMPGVKPYYAVKCNPEPLLLKWLVSYGSGFDCASAREIEAVKSIDVNADIIFANPCKKREDIFYAIESGVKTTVVDSSEEIDKLVSCNWTYDSFIRIRVEDTGSKMPFGAKFGASAESVKGLIDYAKSKGQNISGISFHVGSGCQDASQYKKAIELAGLLNPSNTIDIGGGFTNDGFIKASQEIRRARGYIPSKTKLIAEPGRFFAATSHDLFVKVIGKKPAINGNGYRYTLDESLYGQFSCIPFDQAQPKWIRIRSSKEEKRREVPAILYGRTCDSVDMIAASPSAEELVEGDWLWFPHMGAYTTVTSTEFNGFPKPPLIELEEEPPSPEMFQWPNLIKYVSPVRADFMT
jgi:ornithine decarboxylase